MKQVFGDGFQMGWWRVTGLILALTFATFPCRGQVASTAVEDTVYYANGATASGTILLSWPAFVTAQGETVAAGKETVPIGAEGKVSISLAPNVSATPAGTYYTAVYHLDDGTVTTEYWNVPNVASTTIAAIRTRIMPASVAVQQGLTTSQITSLLTNYLPLNGGTVTGDLLLGNNPSQPMQAVTKEYVDQAIAPLGTAAAHAVSAVPESSQNIVQPQGTGLSVNTFQGRYYAAASQTSGKNDGIAKLTSGAECANSSPGGYSGCTINVEPSYGNQENPQGYGTYLFGNHGANLPWPLDTHVHDERNGVTADYYENPFSLVPAQSAGQSITSDITLDYQKWPAYSGNAAGTEYLQTTDYAGGINFDNYFGAGQPQYFFKPYYNNLALATTNYTSGQQQAIMNEVNCHGTGDCIAMTTAVNCDGGMNAGNDEGCHGGDFTVTEDPVVWRGVVDVSAAVGATVIHMHGTAGQKTQGQDRLVLDTNPAAIITGNSITGYVGALPTGPSQNSTITPNSAQDSNASFPVSTMVQLCYPGSDNGAGGAAGCTAGNQPTGFIPSAPNMISPASSITTEVVAPYNGVSSPQTGLPAGFCTPTTLQSADSGAACYLPPTGVACITDQEEYETVNYTYDASKQEITLLDLRFPHLNGLFFAHGGLCGYAVEQQSDVFSGDSNYNEISQVFPIEGSPNSTSFYYISQRVNLGYSLPVLGVSNEINGASTSGGGECFTLNAFIFQLQPDGQTVVVATNIPFNSGENLSPINGMTLKITTPNSSYNGNYAVSWGTVVPNANEFSYVLPATPTGPAPTSGTASFCNTNYKLYPAVRVNSVLDPGTNQVDGTMITMPSPVAFASGDTTMEPHYPWIYTAHDAGRGVNQFIPRFYPGGALYGMTYGYLLSGSPFIGFQIHNATDQNRYLGYGGTHIPPGTGFDLGGEWKDAYAVNQAPDGSVVRVASCKPAPIGCNHINSNFNVLQMPEGQALNYDPSSSTWTFGANYYPQNNPQISPGGTVQAYNLHALHYVTTPEVGIGGSYLFNAAGNIGVTNTPDSPQFNTWFANYAYGFGTLNGNTVDGFLYHGATPDSIDCGTGTGDTNCTFTLGVLNAGTVVNAPTVAASSSVTTPSLTIGGGTPVTHVAYYSTGSITPAAVPAQSCSDQAFSVSGLSATDHLGSIAPPGALGNLSLIGYPGGADSLVLHICNVSMASATPPTGAYTFLAMH